MQGTEEEACRGAWIVDADRAGINRAFEVRLDDAERAARWCALGLAIEGQPDLGGALVHMNGDHGRDHAGEERHQLAREVLKNLTRILRTGSPRQLLNALRQFDASALHRLEEEVLLRLHVPQQRRRRDAQLTGNVGQGGGLETLLREDPTRRREQLGSLNRRRASHL